MEIAWWDRNFSLFINRLQGIVIRPTIGILIDIIVCVTLIISGYVIIIRFIIICWEMVFQQNVGVLSNVFKLCSNSLHSSGQNFWWYSFNRLRLFRTELLVCSLKMLKLTRRNKINHHSERLACKYCKLISHIIFPIANSENPKKLPSVPN